MQTDLDTEGVALTKEYITATITIRELPARFSEKTAIIVRPAALLRELNWNPGVFLE